MFKEKKYQTILLALLLLSGMLKSFIYTYVGEIDIVLIMSIIVVGDMIISKFSITTLGKRALFMLLFFSVYLMLSMGYSSSSTYLYEKFIGYFLSLILFIYPFFIRKFNPKIFIITYSIILIPLTLFFIRMKSILWTENSIDTELFMDLRSNYLTLAMHLGILIIILNFYGKKIYLQLIYLGLLFATSARGPFIFVILLLIVINLSRFKAILSKSSNFRKFMGLTVGLSVLLYFYWNTISVYFDTAIARFMSVGANDSSLNSRVELMEYAFFKPFENFNHLLFGTGFGSFGIEYTGIDQRAYPHNILLEIFYELGLIGLLLFGIFFLLVFYKGYRNKNVFYFVLIFIVLNSLKSYSLADSWVLFCLLGCVVSNFNVEKSLMVKYK